MEARGRFARPGGANHQHQAALFPDQSLQHGGQIECLDIEHLATDVADDDGDTAALAEYVDAKVADLRHAVGEVHLHMHLEVGNLRRLHHLVSDLPDLFLGQFLLVDRHHHTVDLDIDRRADREEQVGGQFVGGELQ